MHLNNQESFIWKWNIFFIVFLTYKSAPVIKNVAKEAKIKAKLNKSTGKPTNLEAIAGEPIGGKQGTQCVWIESLFMKVYKG